MEFKPCSFIEQSWGNWFLPILLVGQELTYCVTGISGMFFPLSHEILSYASLIMVVIGQLIAIWRVWKEEVQITPIIAPLGLLIVHNALLYFCK